MKRILKSIAKETALHTIYKRFEERLKRRLAMRSFWEWSIEDQTRLAFYQQFIAPGEVVFDVGANLGNRAKIFFKLGAVVVAVEPQSHCSDFLHVVFKDKSNFHLVRKALGASVGHAEMLIADVHTISSLSSEWVDSVIQSGRFAEHRWHRKEVVAIDTLDNLIAQYGRPAFVKIDVEGFEDQVVSGLSSPVGALSMEFTPEFIDSTLECIAHLNRIGDVRFQLSLGESMDFLLPEWQTAEDVKQVLGGLPQEVFGDLYARFNTKSVAAPTKGSLRSSYTAELSVSELGALH